MMKFSTLSIFLCIYLLSFSICNAQSKKTIAQKSSEMTGKLNKEVKLTKLQIIKIKQVNTSYLTGKKILDNKLKSLKKAKKELKKERKTKIDSILTNTQKKKREALKKKKKSKSKKKK